MPRKLTLWRVTYTYQRYSNVKPSTVSADVFDVIQIGGEIMRALTKWPDISVFTVQKIELSESQE
jgi:hypothetical protein